MPDCLLASFFGVHEKQARIGAERAWLDAVCMWHTPDRPFLLFILFIPQDKQARIDAERARLEAVRVPPNHPLAEAVEAVSGQKVRLGFRWMGVCSGYIFLQQYTAAEQDVLMPHAALVAIGDLPT